MEISGFITQGRQDYDQWVTKYKIGYIESACNPVVKFVEENGRQKVQVVLSTVCVFALRVFFLSFNITLFYISLTDLI